MNRCGYCGEPLDGRRADTRWCTDAHRVRAYRLGVYDEIEAMGLTVAEWEQRSEAFWRGMAELAARRGRGRERPGEPVQRPNRKEAA